MAYITYRTSRGCDYDSDHDSVEVCERVAQFVERKADSAGRLAELLVEQGVLDIDALYKAFKTNDDYERTD